MSGWVPMPADVWPTIRERLPRPLSREEACFDLRWWQDRELRGLEEIPSYRKLGASWGWCEPGKDCKKARLLLADETSWSDPFKLAEWREHRGRNQGAARAQPGRNQGATDNGQTPDIEPKGRNEGAEGAQEGRNEGDTRDLFSQTPVTNTPTEDPPLPPQGGAAPPLEDLGVEGAKAELLALQAPEVAPSPRDEALLVAALARGVTAEQLRALWAWSGVSEDPLVAGCRKGGWRRWGSLLRQPQGEARLAAAASWAASSRGSATSAGADTAPVRKPQYRSEEVAAYSIAPPPSRRAS